MRAILLLALALLSGCAALHRDLEEEKASWQGATYDEVVARWGQPAGGQTLPDGLERRTWVSEGASWRPGPSVGVGVFGGSGGGGGVGVGVNVPIGSSPPPMRCERTLYFRNARVVDQEWSGPWEYCSSFRKAG